LSYKKLCPFFKPYCLLWNTTQQKSHAISCW
jgi:hypothetical protein